MKLKRAVVLTLVLALSGVPMGRANAHVNASVNLSFFYDNFEPHGDWVVSANYGHVWRPVGVYSEWRPYWDGRWVYTDLGWTFVSYEPWGWATYHYGRWYLDPYWGWVWVPGTVWGPAWVAFYEGPGWIGWAPLPPGVSIYASFGSHYWRDPGAFCFVEERHFLDPHVSRRVAPVERNTRLVRASANVTHFTKVGNTFVNRGVSVRKIERATGREVERMRIVDATDVRRKPSMRVRGDEVAVFRPQVQAKAERPPKVVRQAPGRGERFEKQGREARSDREVARVERSQKVKREPPTVRTERPPARVKPGKSERRPPATEIRASRRGREEATVRASSRSSRAGMRAVAPQRKKSGDKPPPGGASHQ